MISTEEMGGFAVYDYKKTSNKQVAALPKVYIQHHDCKKSKFKNSVHK